MSLSQEQQNAVGFVLDRVSRGEAVGLSGWAGTGKTFTTAEIIREIDYTGRRVAVLAPTHRACDVLREELIRAGVYADVETVHAGCGLIPCDQTGKALEVAEAKAATADVVIVDEASMVSTALLVAINKLPGTKIFVGDPYQLPPVNENSPPAFHGLTCAQLKTTVRYEAGSDLDELTDALRQCIDAKKLPNIEAIEERMRFFRGGIPMAADLFHRASDRSAIVMGFRNEVVAATCAAIQGGAGHTFEPGEPVVFLEQWAPYSLDRGRGRYIRRVHNGTEGWIESYDDEDNVARIQFKGGGVSDVPVIPPSGLIKWLALKKTVSAMYRSTRDQWERFKRANPILAGFGSATEAKQEMSKFACVRQSWAMTVHKAQGGSYDRAIVLWDDLLSQRRKPELFCRLLYVAATRTRNADELFFVRGTK